MARCLLSQGPHSYWVHLILSLLLPRGAQELNSGHQAWHQAFTCEVEFILISAETPLCLQDWVCTWTQHFLLFFPTHGCVSHARFSLDLLRKTHRLCHFVRGVLQQVPQSNPFALCVWPGVVCSSLSCVQLFILQRYVQSKETSSVLSLNPKNL